MSLRRVAASLIIAALLSGCASTLSGDSYSRDEARKVQTVKMGTVEHVRLVVIEGTKTPIGAAAGGAVGGIAGSTMGHGAGSDIAAVLGAVVGGVAGATVEEQATKRQGEEITVRLENGEILAVVQEKTDKETFNVGDKIRILTVQGTTRVTH